MNRRGRVYLRNKIVKALNNWQQLGCMAWAGPTPGFRRLRKVNDPYSWRLVSGISSEGKAMILYPILKANDRVPLSICRFMLEAESRGAIVACCETIGDAWDAAFDDGDEYPRKRRSYSYRYWYTKHKKEQKNGKTEEE